MFLKFIPGLNMAQISLTHDTVILHYLKVNKKQVGKHEIKPKQCRDITLLPPISKNKMHFFY